MHNVKKTFTFIACKRGLIIMTGSPFFYSECVPSRCLLWTSQWVLNSGGGFVFVPLFWFCWGKLLFVKKLYHKFSMKEWGHGPRRRRSNGLLLLLLWWIASIGNAAGLGVTYSLLFLATVRKICTVCGMCCHLYLKWVIDLKENIVFINNNTKIMLLYEFW